MADRRRLEEPASLLLPTTMAYPVAPFVFHVNSCVGSCMVQPWLLRKMSEDDLRFWMEALPAEQPTGNMMRWMAVFDTPCSRACCFSEDCACIRCNACGGSFTNVANRHSRRFTCMDCPLVAVVAMEKPEPGKAYSVPQTTLCTDCFQSLAVPHEHDQRFCLVDEIGRHSMVTRPVSRSEKVPVTADRLRVAKIDGDCCCCCEPFCESSPAVYPLGCQAIPGHSISVKDKKLGVRDLEVFYCSGCYLQTLKQGDEDEPMAFLDELRCLLCKHATEMEAWRSEFMAELSACENLDVTMRALHQLHPQPWIRSVMVDCAAAVRAHGAAAEVTT